MIRLPNAGCPEPASSTPLATAADLPPILVVGSTTDAETPLQWSQELNGHLPNSQLLVSQTFGHTAFFANPCVAEATGTFIRTGELPAPGTVCPAP